MIERLSYKITEYQMIKGYIRQDEIKIYRYGYILLFEVVINIVIALVLGLTFDKVREIVFFLLFFILLRSFCGGYHADKIWQCIFLSNVVMLAAILINNICYQYKIPILIYILFEICFSVIICILSPVDNKNKRLGKNEKSIYKKCTIIVTIVESSIGIALMLLEERELGYLILYIYLIQIFSIIAANISRLSSDCNMKKDVSG